LASQDDTEIAIANINGGSLSGMTRLSELGSRVIAGVTAPNAMLTNDLIILDRHLTMTLPTRGLAPNSGIKHKGPPAFNMLADLYLYSIGTAGFEPATP
jgi:hypothetical protein